MLILFYDSMWDQPQQAGEGSGGVEFSTDRGRFDEADAVVFHIPQWTPEMMFTPQMWRRVMSKGQDEPRQVWVAWSMECDEHYPLQRDPQFMRLFDLTMTYHPDADIPITYVPTAGGIENFMEELRRPPAAKTETSLAACLISSSFDRSGREDYLRGLAGHIKIDSYGKFMRNRTLDQDTGYQSKVDLLSKYKFSISFENACGKDYVTEKFYDPLRIGSVPIYLGAPNIDEFAPGNHCFINVADFPDPRRLAEYLVDLDRDDDAYQAYFTWKQEPFRDSFLALLGRLEADTTGRLCRLIAARRAIRHDDL